jgi:hypothetical protein
VREGERREKERKGERRREKVSEGRNRPGDSLTWLADPGTREGCRCVVSLLFLDRRLRYTKAPIATRAMHAEPTVAATRTLGGRTRREARWGASEGDGQQREWGYASILGGGGRGGRKGGGERKGGG